MSEPYYYFLYLGDGKCLAKGRNELGHAYAIDFDGTDLSKIRLYSKSYNAEITANKINQDNRYDFKVYAFIVCVIGDKWSYQLRSREYVTAAGKAIYVYSLSTAMTAFLTGKSNKSPVS